jgi:hypothetical protein
VHGTSPKEIAPLLYKKARFKKTSVQKELHQNNWIKNIGEVQSPALLNEYVMLSIMLNSISLNDQDDKIIWRWTSNGYYSVALAYDCQFAGSMTYFPTTNIWKAKSGPKCRFFAWLVMHNRTLTTDNKLKKNWQCNPTCSLCYYQQETAPHLLTQCNYTEALWNLFQGQHNLLNYNYLITRGANEWVRSFIESYNKTDQRTKLVVIFSFWWAIWKE